MLPSLVPGVATTRIPLLFDDTRSRLQQLAIQWAHVLRNRQRWADRERSYAAQAERCELLLGKFGLFEPTLRAIALSGRVEVDVPFTREADGWEARVFPWEYVLSGGTRRFRDGAPLSVTRVLSGPAKGGTVPAAPKILFVRSAPGGLDEEYDFKSEEAVARLLLASEKKGQASPDRWRVLPNPSADLLRSTIGSFKPDVVHIAGFDAEQGRLLLGQPTLGLPDDEWQAMQSHDGYVMQERGRPRVVWDEELAGILTGSGHVPPLVCLNLWNSGSRMAALTVAHGGGVAIGFQDRFDDSDAEVFFAGLYKRLSVQPDVRAGFDAAWTAVLRAGVRIRGSGIVLWSGTSLLSVPQQVTASAPRKAAPAPTPDKVPAGEADQYVELAVEPVTELNYSMLHNNRDIFRTFKFTTHVLGPLHPAAVLVELHLGDAFPYRASIDLDGPAKELRDEIRVALTSALARSAHEPILTTLYVEATWGVHELLRRTYQVKLLPVDQWSDSDLDRIWLPSFVLPRDPAVGRVVEMAQRYLMAIQDDPTTGFAGYQYYDPTAHEPTEAIDQQVQAVWSAILYDLRLSYINPPPAYGTPPVASPSVPATTSQAPDDGEGWSQRIRTPSDVWNGGSGTCLDLAILLASCLELIDIYPVIFLLQGHAFPGYWRSEVAYNRFVGAQGQGSVSPSDRQGTRPTPVNPNISREPWYLDPRLDPEVYGEILRYVRSGDLVPIETVALTEHKGFAEAVEAGLENLEDPKDFHSMVDVTLARRHDVTPLPVVDAHPLRDGRAR